RPGRKRRKAIVASAVRDRGLDAHQRRTAGGDRHSRKHGPARIQVLAVDRTRGTCATALRECLRRRGEQRHEHRDDEVDSSTPHESLLKKAGRIASSWQKARTM